MVNRYIFEEEALSFSFLPSLIKGSTHKGKNLLLWEQILSNFSCGSKFFPLRVDQFRQDLSFGKANKKSQKVVSLCENG